MDNAEIEMTVDLKNCMVEQVVNDPEILDFVDVQLEGWAGLLGPGGARCYPSSVYNDEK